jgi:hypothetical protein
MLEAVRTSETSVNFNVTTRRYIPEDSKLHKNPWFFNFVRRVTLFLLGPDVLSSALF